MIDTWARQFVTTVEGSEAEIGIDLATREIEYSMRHTITMMGEMDTRATCATVSDAEGHRMYGVVLGKPPFRPQFTACTLRQP